MNTEDFKNQLEKEKRELEETLGSIGHKTKVGNTSDWEPSFPDLNPMQMEKSEVADEIEEFDNRIGVGGNLEDRLRDINGALERIEKGKFGICKIGGEPISEERLRANPAAENCVAHENLQN